jgi:tetratricopeptide (TPR) repeat protein
MRRNFHILLVCALLMSSGLVWAQPKTAFVDTTPKLETLNEQIKRNPADAQAYSNRGYVLALLGRKEEARADLRKTIELKNNGPMHNRVGWAYFNLREYSDALKEFETAAEMSNRKAHYDYYSLVLGYWGAGDLKKAMENYQLAVERDPRFGEYKTLNERTAEWTVIERRAIHEVYVLWSKTWKPQ